MNNIKSNIDYRMEQLKKADDFKKEVRYHMDWLLEIVEECYPRYSSSDRILEIDDFYKKYFD